MRVHTIPAGAPFLDVLARGLLARCGGDKLALARATVLLPTRRAARALAAALLRESGGAATLAPRTLALGDVDDDDAWTDADAAERDGVPPAVEPLDRLVRLAEMVRARPEIDGDPAAAVRLAASLAALLDSAALEETDLANLEAIVPGDLADHWERSLAALAAARAAWPAELRRLGLIDVAERRVRLLRALAARWRADPPTGLVVAAGSTGTVKATADLLATVARLPDGHVVLPGLDRALDEAAWRAAGEDPCHPQHALARLLERLGIARAGVDDWIAGLAPAPRARLLAEAMRPAAGTAAWRDAAPPPDEALTGLERVEADGPDEEAGAIALALRGALETLGRTAALVTPDRALARRVAAELGRWGVAVDDSAGSPLARTPPGALLRLTAAAALGGAGVDVLAALKHPLARAGRPRAETLRLARRLERRILRRAPAPSGLDAILAAAAADPALADLAAGMRAAFAPLRSALACATAAPRDLLAAHVAAAEFLATGPDSPEAAGLWSGEAGAAAARAVRGLDEALAAMAPIRGDSWPALFEALIDHEVVRPRGARHPRLAIWGPLEARLQAADLMVLGGLNEGTWPPAAPEDPWLSRGMRRALGLPAPERRVGLSAQDFAAAAAAAPAVLLTRSRKIDGAPTRPARFLQRLDALLAADERWARTLVAPKWRAWHAALDRPGDGPTPAPAPRPCPPAEARPRRLRITQVETWIRDPYAIYAREILGLEPLDPLDPEPAGADRGSAVHDALRLFHEATREAWPADPLATLLDAGHRAFAPLLARPAVRAIWWPRFERIAAWLVAWEGERRAAGVAPLAAERRGRLTLERPGGAFILDGRADRIDRLPGGALAILDWKTGGAPTAEQMASGLTPQLAIEALIAAERGFEGGLGGAVEELLHVRLAGGDPAGTPETYQPPKDRPEMTTAALIAATRTGLEKLIDGFDRPGTPYLSRPRPQFLRHAGAYDHLARVREWSAGLGDEP